MRHIRFQATSVSLTGPKSCTVILTQTSPIPSDERDRAPQLTFFSIPVEVAPIIGQEYRLALVPDREDEQ